MKNYMLERHSNWKIGWDQRTELRELEVPFGWRGLGGKVAIKEEKNGEKDHKNKK